MLGLNEWTGLSTDYSVWWRDLMWIMNSWVEGVHLFVFFAHWLGLRCCVGSIQNVWKVIFWHLKYLTKSTRQWISNSAFIKKKKKVKHDSRSLQTLYFLRGKKHWSYLTFYLVTLNLYPVNKDVNFVTITCHWLKHPLKAEMLSHHTFLNTLNTCFLYSVWGTCM